MVPVDLQIPQLTGRLFGSAHLNGKSCGDALCALSKQCTIVSAHGKGLHIHYVLVHLVGASSCTCTSMLLCPSATLPM